MHSQQEIRFWNESTIADTERLGSDILLFFSYVCRSKTDVMLSSKRTPKKFPPCQLSYLTEKYTSKKEKFTSKKEEFTSKKRNLQVKRGIYK
jgi:hypothetical protein